eukprot:GHRQ01023770.1.p1 GENE.GHRQ01023770.1~~GHRQ01023770.1.p1  ORF type:complete len:121 (+),score=2.56 GHRQ01023770.1:554-916(+)
MVQHPACLKQNNSIVHANPRHTGLQPATHAHAACCHLVKTREIHIPKQAARTLKLFSLASRRMTTFSAGYTSDASPAAVALTSSWYCAASSAITYVRTKPAPRTRHRQWPFVSHLSDECE